MIDRDEWRPALELGVFLASPRCWPSLAFCSFERLGRAQLDSVSPRR